MRLIFSKNTYLLEDLIKGKINQKKIPASERSVIDYVLEWTKGTEAFTFRTSGSTGPPKKIRLHRAQLEYSALRTIDVLFGSEKPQRFLLCLDPDTVGGRMVIIRALICKSDLIIVPPSADPLTKIDQSVDLASMVPLQVQSTVRHHPQYFDRLKYVLIGGAELDESTKNRLLHLTTCFYVTYGMTETASHVAIKRLDEEYFRSVGDIAFDVDDRGCLKMMGTVTRGQWIQTNDVVALSENRFKWLGRADWVINSGGVKIHPEQLEQKIRHFYPEVEIAISYKQDDRLGQKVIMLSTRPILDSLRSASKLEKYEIPKEEIIIESIPRLANRKLDRLKLKELSGR